MKLTKRITALSIASFIFTSCKNEEKKSTHSAAADYKISDKQQVFPYQNLNKASFKIEGMTCSVGCAKTIEKELSNLDGVEEAVVDFEKKTATVRYDKTLQNPENLTKTVQKLADGKTYKVSNMKF